MSWVKGGITQIGFVASEGTPLAAATGYPLDFIALCQAGNNSLGCKPMRYSIPLGLYDALDDEALEVSQIIS